MELFLRGPITDDIAPVHLQRAWYAALGSAGVRSEQPALRHLPPVRDPASRPQHLQPLVK